MSGQVVTNVMSAVLALAYIILLWYVYWWIVKLESTGCECSTDWKRTFIKIYTLIIIPVVLLVIVFPMALSSLMFIFNILFIVIVFLYIHDLKKKKCECSESVTRDVLEIVNYIQIGLTVLGVLGAVLMVGIISRMLNRSGKLNSARTGESLSPKKSFARSQRN